MVLPCSYIYSVSSSVLCFTDDGSVSFASEAPTPTKRDRFPLSDRQGPTTSPPLAWRPQGWSRSNDAVTNNHNSNNLGGLADVTARIYSSSSGESSQEELARKQQQQSSRARRHRGHGDSSAGRKSSGGSHRGQTERDAVVVELRSKLAAARARLEQKEVVTKSLQRQLDQVRLAGLLLLQLLLLLWYYLSSVCGGGSCSMFGSQGLPECSILAGYFTKLGNYYSTNISYAHTKQPRFEALAL